MFYLREIVCFLFSSKILYGLANNQVAQQREASLIVLPPIILGYDEFYDDGSKDKSNREHDKSSQEKDNSVANSKDNHSNNDKSHNIQDHHGNNNHNSQEKNDNVRSDDGHHHKSKKDGSSNVGERSHKLSHKSKCRARNGNFNGKSCPFKKKEY
ncbi:unnamed protein product [Pieris brassicae]|uniref:Uncharacterized protein n=1 Tax=Pieris brassicae TaxID=7116 RepID=A0A9P0TE97_PIEBR|nr:unnamed protein product [Pieris brassicae]